MKRGQVTLLVIIGVILLFTVSILLYLSRVSYTDQLQAQAQETVNQFIESNSLSQYVSTCLNRVASEGVELLGRQGGVIYRSQGGWTEDNVAIADDRHVRFEGYNVSYGVQEISQDVCINYQQHNQRSFNIEADNNSEYPVEGVSFQQFQDTFISRPQDGGCIDVGASRTLRRSGFLGYKTYPALCTSETAADLNFPDLPISRVITCTNDFQESDAPEDEELPSIERQLELYIRNNMVGTLQAPGCFNKSVYEELGDEIDIDLDNFEVDIYFTDPSGILIDAEFPFEVSVQGEKPIVTIVDFQQQLDINFLEMYRFMYELLGRMAQDPFFRFDSQTYENWESYVGKGFSVELLDQTVAGSVNSYSYTHDNILRLTNTKNQLNGEPYVYQTAIRQRRPVLDLIFQEPSRVQFPFQDLGGDPVLVDFLLYPGQELEFDVRAMDPDNDEVTVEFFGWKQTTDSYFDSVCCANNACDLNSYSQCLITSVDANLGTDVTRLNFSICRQTGACTRANFDNDQIPIEHFVPGDEFYFPQLLQSQFDASGDGRSGTISFEVDETDTGYHEILVMARDEHGAEDFQWVRILVYDIPIAILNLSNLYDPSEILPGLASIEEPYFLDPRQSQASAFDDGGDLSSFIFRLHYDGYNATSENPSFDFEDLLDENRPYNLPGDNYQITDIRNQIFPASIRAGLPRDQPREIDVSLEVRQEIADGLDVPPSIPSVQSLSIYECLPVGFDRRNNPAGTGGLAEYYDVDISEPYYSSYLAIGVDEEDKFNLPSVCCEPLDTRIATPPHTGGTFADPSEVCFADTFQTCYPPLDERQYGQYFLRDAVDETSQGDLVPLVRNQIRAPYPPPSGQVGNSPFPNAINDVWFLEQEQSCSGNRGNVCSGNTELIWTLGEACGDFGDVTNQYARCEGPGLSAPYQTLSRCFDRPDAGMTCQQYNALSSFEQRILGVTVTNSQGYTTQTAEAIQRGYCSGPTRADLSSIQNGQVDGSTNGDFACFGSCGGSGSAGTCAYNSDHCFCEEQPARPIGTGYVTASDFLGGELFSCTQDRVAYSNQCQVFDQDSAPSCFCQLQANLNRFSGGVTQGELNAFSGYFGNKNAGTWIHQGGNCCVGGTFSTSRQPITTTNDDSSLCFDGEVTTSGTIFSYQGLTNRFLSLRGQVFYCEEPTQDVFAGETSVARSFVAGVFIPNDAGDVSVGVAPFSCTSSGWIST